MKTHPLVAHFKDKNLRPFSADADAKLVHIPSLREILDKSGALRAKSIFSDTVFQIVQGSLLGSHPNTEATVLDIRSTDAFSKEKISSLRQIILDKNKLQWRLRARYLALSVQKKFRWLDGQEYNFGQKNEESRSLCMLLNEIYQLAVLGMNKDGYAVPPDQMNRVFQTFEAFDEFVASLNAEPVFEWKEKYRARYERVIQCVEVRYMINIFDTLNSEKYREVVEDREVILEKLTLTGLKVSPGRESGVYYIEYPGRENFRGTLTLDEKTFDSINTKKRSNRPYTSAESMADLFRMRFEGEVGNKENMTRAVNFFTQHFFAEQSIKIRWDLVQLKDIENRSKLKKLGTLGKASTVTTLSNAAIIGVVRSWKSTTDEIECQFQHEGEMETGVNSTEIYDLKKYLTGICRDIGSVDMANVLFYVRLLPLEKIKMTEQEVLDHLFLPQSMTHITSSRPLSLQETRSKKENLSLIEQLWRSPVGFMLPVRTKKGVRFMTQMSFSPKVFDLYTDLYAPAPLVEKSPTILKKMVEWVDALVTIRIEEFRERLSTYEPMRKHILSKYRWVE